MKNCNNSQNTVVLPNENDIPTSGNETSNTDRNDSYASHIPLKTSYTILYRKLVYLLLQKKLIQPIKICRKLILTCLEWRILSLTVTRKEPVDLEKTL